jgi:Ca2+-binding RTX toxin-like protein
VDHFRILALVIFSITMIYLSNIYFNVTQGQSTDTAGSISTNAPGNVINASDMESAEQSSIEAFQSSSPLPSNSIDSRQSGQSASGATNDEQELIDANTLLQQLQRPVVGSFGDDRITGTEQTDIIIGFSGSDTITGMNGSDVIQGNEGQEKLYGDEGNDILQGGIGSDQLYGGDGNDILAGGGDDDFLVGEDGNDKLYGDLGDDVLVGGPGADYFDCGEGVDVVADFNIQQGDDRAGNCEELIELS